MRIAEIDPPAMAALDMALWDLLAKQANLPPHRMLGLPKSTHPTSVTIGINPPEVTKERVPKIISSSGAKCLKIKLGSPQGRDHDKSTSSLRQRRQGRSESRLRVDANGGWTVGEAKMMCEWLADLQVDYVEQPLKEAGRGGIARGVRPSPPAHFCRRVDSFFTRCDRGGRSSRWHQFEADECAAESPRPFVLSPRQESFGLQTMIGCMSETSIAIAAGAAIRRACSIISILNSQI